MNTISTLVGSLLSDVMNPSSLCTSGGVVPKEEVSVEGWVLSGVGVRLGMLSIALLGGPVGMGSLDWVLGLLLKTRCNIQDIPSTAAVIRTRSRRTAMTAGTIHCTCLVSSAVAAPLVGAGLLVTGVVP